MVVHHPQQVMREFPEPGSCDALAGCRTRKRGRPSPRYDAWHAEGGEGWKRAPFSPTQVTAATPATADTPGTITHTRPPKRGRSGSVDGDGSTPAMVGGGDALCAMASPPKRHTPPAKEASVIREMEVTPRACGDSGEDLGMTGACEKGSGDGPGEEDGRRCCLPGGGVGAAPGDGVAVTPLEKTPQMPDPESMRKCLDEYMEVRWLLRSHVVSVLLLVASPCSSGISTIRSGHFNCTVGCLCLHVVVFSLPIA